MMFNRLFAWWNSWFHFSARQSDGTSPVGFGVRLFLWRRGMFVWAIQLDLLFGLWDVQFGIHGPVR